MLSSVLGILVENIQEYGAYVLVGNVINDNTQNGIKNST